MRRTLALLALLVTSCVAQQQEFWWLTPEGPPTDTTPSSTTPVAPSDNHIPDPNYESTWEPCVCQAGLRCQCVIYYLCVDGVISSAGAGLLGERLNVPLIESCAGVQKCCQEPNQTMTDQGPGPDTTPEPGKDPDAGSQPPIPTDPGNGRTGCGQRLFRSDDDDGNVNFGEFPWMLALFRIKNGENDPSFHCGASLIHPQVAMTAAHCIKDASAAQLSVRAGEMDARTDTEPLPHQDRAVASFIVHPRFDRLTLYNDVALLFLDAPFSEALNVDVICLPPPNTLFDGERCIATGWGPQDFTQGGQDPFQSKMKKVNLPMVERGVCQDRLRKTRLGRFFLLHESFVCAGGEPNRDTCKGDGGGPLICPVPGRPDRYVQAGIVSWGIDCGSPLIPAVYSSVSHLRPWIDQQLEAAGLKNIADPQTLV